jgi:glycosyltransferase involved in cell wall biosynthesis
MHEIVITVLMPVYNAEKHLKAAIDSILNQSFREFEFLIINDGSTDSSHQIVNSFIDERIVYIHNKQNKGIVQTLNEGLSLSRGDYIARMDADDIAFPARLQNQLDYMLKHPHCHLCGSQAIAISEYGEKLYNLKRPCKNEDIKVQQLFRNCFIHPAVMMSKQITANFLYTLAYQYAEDYLLFSQIALKYEVANLKHRLLSYRIHEENITSHKKSEMMNSERKVIRYLLEQLFDNQLEESSIAIHHQIIRRDFAETKRLDFEFHLLSIKKANGMKNIYPAKALNKALQKEWFNFLYFRKSKNDVLNFINSPLFSLSNINFKQLFKLAVK